MSHKPHINKKAISKKDSLDKVEQLLDEVHAELSALEFSRFLTSEEKNKVVEQIRIIGQAAIVLDNMQD
jgi:DNA integrity scanning protein DisA with diadenylate cyclase activity